MVRRSGTAVAACVALLAACAGTPRADRYETVAWERSDALPPGVAAAIVGGALRSHLPFADPLPQAHGVLASPQGAHHWRLQWHAHGRGVRAAGSHRLGIVLGPDRTASCVVHPSRSPDSAPVGGATFTIDIVALATGCHLRGELPPTWTAAIDRALALAHDPRLALPGLREPNLAAWAQHRLLEDAAACAQRGDTEGAQACVLAAARLPHAFGARHEALAAQALAAGDPERAHDHAWRAVLAATDPAHRQQQQAQFAHAGEMLAAAERRAWLEQLRAQPALARMLAASRAQTTPAAAPTR